MMGMGCTVHKTNIKVTVGGGQSSYIIIASDSG